VLTEVNLWKEVKDRLKNLATTLSVGQQQRLAIARTLAVGPEVLLLDEPTYSLDPESAAAIESLIESLKTQHTILLVTHLHEQAEKVSDNLIFCNIIK
jgi:phosphate transport system ATP-binding protein